MRRKNYLYYQFAATTISIVLLSSCSIVQEIGGGYRQAGEAMESYGSKDDGIISKMLRTGGRINKKIGASLEGSGKKKNVSTQNTASVSQHTTQAATASPLAQAQQALNAAGYNAGPVDGVMGAKTRSAIRQYQQEQGLSVNGQLDSDTRAVLGVQ